jgi:hypothetical protein
MPGLHSWITARPRFRLHCDQIDLLAAMPEATCLPHYKQHCGNTVLLPALPVAHWLAHFVSTPAHSKTAEAEKLKAATLTAPKAESSKS